MKTPRVKVRLALGSILLATLAGAAIFTQRDGPGWPSFLGFAGTVRGPIAASLLAANARYKFNDGVVRRGWSTIHKLDDETASRVETALHRSSARVGLPVNYLAAYVQQESTGDPKAEYRNPAKWDAASDEKGKFSAIDHGLVQISGGNLIALYPGASMDSLKAKAEDIDFAVEYLADYVAKEIAWASKCEISPKPGIDNAQLERAKNPYWLAALSYNRGRASALSVLDNPRGCKHANLIMDAWLQIDERSGANVAIRAPSFKAANPVDPRRLAKGDIGQGVESLQRLLNIRLDPSPSLKVDGNFGTATRNALSRFQEANGLEPTGVTDGKTWDALMGKKSGELEGYSSLVMGDKGKRVEELQRALNDKLRRVPGLSIDGNFGQSTRDALIFFQRDQKLPETGVLDSATYRSLNGTQ